MPNSAVARRGFFGNAVLTEYPDKPVEDEGRLKNFLIRESFLCRRFALARFRRLRTNPSMAALIEFHARHKLLLLANNQTALRQLGRIVANSERRPLSDLLDGYFSRGLSADEKAFFLETIAGYRAGKLPRSVSVGLLLPTLSAIRCAS